MGVRNVIFSASLANAHKANYTNVMDVNAVNRALAQGEIDTPHVLPHADELRELTFQFEYEFGLHELPTQPGVLIIRGPRQYGKSTWLELQIEKTVLEFGKGSAFYLNGDELTNATHLIQAIRAIITLFPPKQKVKRLFVDEVTAVDNWEKAIKRLVDSGELRDILLITTGSKAADLRHGSERLPGRKGNLERTSYLFTPISFKEFEKKCGSMLKEKTLSAYILAGGAPFALSQIVCGKLAEYTIETLKDWIYGECAATGRNRSSLIGVMDAICRFGTSPVGQAKLAREAGLANNSIAAGYINLLTDLLCVTTQTAYDSNTRTMIRRKPAKFPFVNLLAAVAWHPKKIRSIDEFESLDGSNKGTFYEWLIAQELFRRRAIQGIEIPEELSFWQGKNHEIDFVMDEDNFIEVKGGEANPVEFTWFSSSFPKAHLTVINRNRFEARSVSGITFEDFLLQSVE